MLARVALVTLIGAATVAPSLASAQNRRFETRSTIGAFIPTGDQRDEQKDGLLMGSGLGYHLMPSVTLVGSFGMSKNTAKEISGEPDVTMYSYDAGIEYHPFQLVAGTSWQLRPFVGGGIGGRTYDSDVAGAETQTDLTGYGTLGLRADYKRVGFRIEGRDYVSRYDGLAGTSESVTRNDIGLTTGFMVHF